jgi:hypothetical protein
MPPPHYLGDVSGDAVNNRFFAKDFTKKTRTLA